MDTQGTWLSFQSIRKRHNENICHETNKLLLRLDRLINEDNKVQMRDHERSVVDWTSDDIVKLCPFCAKSFTLSRRRHHCRLCGAVMCHGCSLFLDYDAACKLVKPTDLEAQQDGDMTTRQASNSSNQTDPQLSKIRLCEDCKRLLDKRLQSIEDHYYHPFFCDFYAKLRSRITSADELLVTYDKMCQSLKIGEEDYKMQDAQELRAKLDALRNNIAHMAKNITTLASTTNEKEIQLVTAIRQSIGFWVKKYESLAAYPTEEEYEELKLKRRQQIEEQLSMNKTIVACGNENTLGDRVNSGSSSPRPEMPGLTGLPRLSNSRGMKRSITMGDNFNANSAWMPDQSMLDTEEANPLLIQIRNLEEYIKQARNASRYEEVSTLEANLRDLEIEFLIQQGDSVHLDDPTTSD